MLVTGTPKNGSSPLQWRIKLVLTGKMEDWGRSPTSFRLPLIIKPLGGGAPKTTEAIGLSQSPITFLTTELDLPEGTYRVTSSEIPKSVRNFRLTRSSAAPIRHCDHSLRTPSTTRHHICISSQGQPVFVEQVVQWRACCEDVFLRTRTLPPHSRQDNPYALRLYQPLQEPLALFVDGIPWTVRPGEYLLVNPESVSWMQRTQRWPFTIRSLSVSQTILRTIRDALGLPKGRGSLQFKEGPHRLTPGLSHLLEVLNEPDTGNFLADDYLQHFAHLLVSKLLRDHPNHLRDRAATFSQGFEDGRLRAAVDYLTRHSAKSFSMTDLARQVGASEDWLQKAFQRAFRVSPSAFRQSVRVKKAIELLERDHHTMFAVAREVGYHNERALQRAFAAQAKAPPQMFRVK